MIHYSCDCCGRSLDSKNDMRYVIKIEVYAAVCSLDEEPLDDDRDHLEEIQDILERTDDAENENIGDDVYDRIRFDLCPKCRKRFIKNPLRAPTMQPFDFSKN